MYAGSVYWPFHLDRSTGFMIAAALALILILINIVKAIKEHGKAG